MVLLDDEAALGELDLGMTPNYDPAVYPRGVNVEFVVVRADDELVMRVHERGVGETMSCGTGVVAAAAAQLARLGRPTGAVHVNVPGGRLLVEQDAQQSFLTGPAVVVAHGSAVLPEGGGRIGWLDDE